MVNFSLGLLLVQRGDACQSFAHELSLCHSLLLFNFFFSLLAIVIPRWCFYLVFFFFGCCMQCKYGKKYLKFKLCVLQRTRNCSALSRAANVFLFFGCCFFFSNVKKALEFPLIGIANSDCYCFSVIYQYAGTLLCAYHLFINIGYDFIYRDFSTCSARSALPVCVRISLRSFNYSLSFR